MSSRMTMENMSHSKPCCGASERHDDHDDHQHDRANAGPKPTKEWYCPMCPGVEADQPGACPKCGMALERNLALVRSSSAVYTCPMHPEVRQDHPGVCPICGMNLEPVQA